LGGLAVRQMRESDLERACEVTRRTVEWLGEREGWRPEQMAHLVADQASPESMGWVLRRHEPFVATVDGVLVGMASAQRCELARLYVDPSHHRRGIGTALFGAVEEGLRGAGCVEMAVKSPPTSVPFYQTMGMVEQGRQPWGADFMSGHQLVLMAKRLAGGGGRRRSDE